MGESGGPTLGSVGRETEARGRCAGRIGKHNLGNLRVRGEAVAISGKTQGREVGKKGPGLTCYNVFGRGGEGGARSQRMGASIRMDGRKKRERSKR